MTLTPVKAPPPRGDFVHSTPEERERRLGLLREGMAQQGLAALVVCGRDDIRYRGRTFWVSDVWQLLADTHVVILPEGDPIFIGGQVFGLEQAEQALWPGEFRVSGLSGVEIADVLSSNGLGDAAVGITGLSDASFAAWHLQQMTEALPGLEIHDATQLFEDARHTNSDEELYYLRVTSELFNDIYEVLEPSIRPGMTEIELAAESHKVSREFGLRDPMVLMQTSPYGPLSFGTTKVIEKEDIVTLWIESAGPTGYWLEYRRCYTFGPPTPGAQEFWDLSVDSLNAGLAAMKPGAMASAFVEAVHNYLVENSEYHLGYTHASNPHSMFSLHGIDCDAIKGVWVPGNDRVLKDTEVVNIHPTVEFKDHATFEKYSWLGITDNALVTEDGGVLMTHSPDLPDGFKEL